MTIKIVPFAHNILGKLTGYFEQKKDVDYSWQLHSSNALVEAWLLINHLLYLSR